ncbi:MAG: hypothetical protein K6G85_03150 [Eubacterium sp.]|nr:hypothetical protein [Eubacterium sp.]
MSSKIPNIQTEYLKRIKAQLRTAFFESRYSYTQLQAILEERYGFNINKGTLQDLFNPDSNSLNYACLVTTCDFFGLDFNKLLQPKLLKATDSPSHKTTKSSAHSGDFSNIEPFLESIQAVNKKFSVLRDDGYMQSFKGYVVAPTKSNSIEKFDLTLYKDDNGVAHAKLIRSSKNGDSCFKYEGIPYYSKAYQAVLIFLTDKQAKGEFYFLSFGFQEYRSNDGLQFRQGLAITGASLHSGTMVSQNFLLFSHPLSPEMEKFVPGLLKPPVNEFCVPVSTVERLAELHPEVRTLMDKLSGTLSHEKEDVYIFNEDSILSLTRVKLSSYERIKALLLLKEEALISEKNCYVVDSKFSSFAKNYMLE